MKKMLALLTNLFILASLALWSQDYQDNVLISIDGKEITAGEFLRSYNKNNSENVEEKQSIEEYLEMFINFKLKVTEAENRGMDTTTSFLNEFNAYKKQLAKPYLTDPEITNKLAMEAYERMKTKIHASHIMVQLDRLASPEDTLYAWEKIMEIRKRVINGEDFEKVARATSDDPSVKRNGGDLGWFTVFRLVYPFENVAYATEVGEISMPFRTDYGYHIVKIHDKTEAHGEVRIRHLFLSAPFDTPKEEQEEVQKRIFAIYDSIQNGASFAELARHNSDDQQTAHKGGEMDWFTPGQVLREIEITAFSMNEIGKVSQPFRSNFGWHIVKLLDRKPIKSFEEEEAEIMDRIKNGKRSYLRTEAYIEKLKNEYNYTLYKENLQKLYSRVDTTIFDAAWNPKKASAIADLKLAEIGNKTITIGDFADYLAETQKDIKIISEVTYVNNQFDDFEEKIVLDYEESMLSKKYPDFKYIVQEYHDGILLFDITNKLVWNKAAEDTAGLEKFWKNHKNDYMWEERVEAYTITVEDSSLIDEAIKLTEKHGGKRRFDEDYLNRKLCRNDTCVAISYKRYEKGDSEQIDRTGWEKGTGEVFVKNDKPAFVYIIGTLQPSPKDLEDARGIITADYQEYLEEKWIEQLRDKYKVQVNRDLLSKIKSK